MIDSRRWNNPSHAMVVRRMVACPKKVVPDDVLLRELDRQNRPGPSFLWWDGLADHIVDTGQRSAYGKDSDKPHIFQ